MTLQEKILQLKTFIKDTGIITHFGGLCYLNNEDGNTYGISFDSEEIECKGNIYGNNHNEISGFLSINNISSKDFSTQIVKNIARVELHMFTPHKLVGELMHNYYTFAQLFSLLNQKFWKSYELSHRSSSNKHKDIEYNIITIDIPFMGACAPYVKKDEIC